MSDPSAPKVPIWEHPVWSWVIAAMIGALFLLFAYWFIDLVRSTPTESVSGIIIDVKEFPRYSRELSSGYKTMLVVRAEDGSEHTLNPDLRNLNNCRIGGEVALYRKGQEYWLAHKACPAPIGDQP